MGFIYIRFYEELNDFLPEFKRKKTYKVEDVGKRTVNDLIQSQGVPHTEVDLILVNGISVDFGHHINTNDYISVYPVFESFDISPVEQLRDKPLRNPQFLLDVHLGKLTKYLRMLGFDVAYQNHIEDEEIVLQALVENRVILTRDIGLLKRNDVQKGYWLRNTQPKKQLAEVLKRFDLYHSIQPFRICMKCNGTIVKVDKEQVKHKLLRDTLLHFSKFYQCTNCHKIYWEGSHHDHMMQYVEELRSEFGVRH